MSCVFSVGSGLLIVLPCVDSCWALWLRHAVQQQVMSAGDLVVAQPTIQPPPIGKQGAYVYSHYIYNERQRENEAKWDAYLRN